MFVANISEINPLAPGNFIIVLHPDTKLKEIIIGEVVTMYTTSGARNAQHQWIASITSVSISSYVNIQVYRRFSGDTLSSLSCGLLGCSTFLRIPRTHTLLSLASCTIPRLDQATPAGQPYTLITPPSFAMETLKLLQTRAANILLMVKDLKKLVNGQTSVTEQGGEDSTNSDH